MGLLSEFNTKDVLRFSYGMEKKAIESMEKAIKFHWRCRTNATAKSRILSAVAVIRELKGVKGRLEK